MNIVFFGDSITDCGRGSNTGANYFLGHGYATMVGGRLTADHPGEYVCYNQGISGHRIVDLYARIKKDLWNLNPGVASILIGVNDVWHEYGHKNGVETDRFERIYDMLVAETLERLPGVKLLILEPYVLCGTATRDNYVDFRREVEEKAAASRRIAEKYALPFIPLQKIFDDAAAAAGDHPELFAADGVHPSPAGHQLIADAWLKAFAAL